MWARRIPSIHPGEITARGVFEAAGFESVSFGQEYQCACAPCE